MINSLILAISSSIDSLGIGITYGLRNTKISNIGKIILFLLSIFITFTSVLLGNFLKNIFPLEISTFIGSSILVFMGIFIIFQALNNNENTTPKPLKTAKKYSFFIKCLGITIQIIKNPISSDLDNSKNIDYKEALFLGLALSLDSFGIGIGSSIINTNIYLFPLLVASLQIIFLSLGSRLGKSFKKLNFSQNIWSIISGILLIFIGILKSI